jgi:hypothetical protein
MLTATLVVAESNPLTATPDTSALTTAGEVNVRIQPALLISLTFLFHSLLRRTSHKATPFKHHVE